MSVRRVAELAGLFLRHVHEWQEWAQGLIALLGAVLITKGVSSRGSYVASTETRVM